MGKFSKKIRRDRTKQAEKDLSQKVNMFDRLPDSCTACSKPFDKLDREMVMSWNVVVKDQDKQVNLYCPPCWDKANEILEDFKNRLMEKMQNDSEES
tara:strand:+ start:960 stop:1250 length:291 start_codon:yes stop_codon:yes gene_type:complete